jgi:hypothetical protein
MSQAVIGRYWALAAVWPFGVRMGDHVGGAQTANFRSEGFRALIGRWRPMPDDDGVEPPASGLATNYLPRTWLRAVEGSRPGP